MPNGLVCTIDRPPVRVAARLPDALAAVLVYAALWACLCSMAAISDAGLAPLSAGACLCAALAAAPRHRPWAAVLTAAGLAAAAALVLCALPDARDGAAVLLNRLFAASEARQAYLYDYLPVSAAEADWTGCVRTALWPLGLAAGIPLGLAARWRSPLAPAGMFALFALLSAYLGITPHPICLAALAAALCGVLSARPAAWTAFAAGLFIAAAVFFALPGENARLSALDERLRDALALHTTAHADAQQTQPQTEQQAAEERDFYRQEETQADLGGDEHSWTRPLSAALVIALLALVLFVPAIWSDVQKKRRARSRAGMDDARHDAAICAAFLYALRWLRLGGLDTPNAPFSTYAAAVGEHFTPDLRARYEDVLPLWHEAAYSDHAMTEEQRRRMRDFADAAQQAAWDRLNARQRLRARLFCPL